MKFILLAIFLIGAGYALFPSEREVATFEDLIELSNPFVDFFNGFIDGIKRKFDEDVTTLAECIAAPKKIMLEWNDFFNYLKTFDWKNFKQLFEELYYTIEASVIALVPCVWIGLVIDKFVELIWYPTLENLKLTLIKTIATNANFLIKVILDIVKCIVHLAWFGAGSDIGLILYIIVIH